jgi:hypothetical protein
MLEGTLYSILAVPNLPCVVQASNWFSIPALPAWVYDILLRTMTKLGANPTWVPNFIMQTALTSIHSSSQGIHNMCLFKKEGGVKAKMVEGSSMDHWVNGLNTLATHFLERGPLAYERDKKRGREKKIETMLVDA